ncbi:RNA-dependent RNA polymerase [Ganda bee virus]|uniref:RNA-directed RNA polymerase L n=1 Tax=Ganda bee virus TaxID=1931095 RepID=A0A1L7B5J5_9VIRU|nr:RNA-dependent RNA polymerase [Ganda bee virus]APT68154.1 RNA-dependent RNA polymerase [Ganda bee virus]
MERFFDREGRADRTRRFRGPRRGSEVDLQATSQIEVSIKLIREQLDENWRSLPHTKALNCYLNARSLRHDLWLDFLKDNRSRNEFTFTDTRVLDFVNKLKTDRIVISNIEVPSDIAYKTPDMLIYNSYNKCVILGDISVSSSVVLAEQRKYEKYLKVKNFLIEIGMRVQHVNFIVDEDLHNIDRLVNMFYNYGIISINQQSLLKTRTYHLTCNKLMSDAKNHCDDKIKFNEILALTDRSYEYEGLNIDYEPSLNLKYEKAIRTEDEIVNMIKNECDNLCDKYFDNGFEDAKIKFNELIESFKNREHMKPKATLKVIHNSRDLEEFSGHKLIRSYLMDIAYADEEMISNYVLNLLPNSEQLADMETKFNDNVIIDKEELKRMKVYGKWQYNIIVKYHGNLLTLDTKEKLTRGKRNPNEKKEPKTIDPDNYDNIFAELNMYIEQLGSISNKMPFLSDEWDAMTNNEMDQTQDEKEIYNYVRRTQGPQLGQSLSMLYQRLTHLKTNLSMKDNIFVPPNGSFICIIPKEHQPFTGSKADVPLIFITRVLKQNNNKIFEHEFTFSTNNYIYYVSKLCRLSLDKIAHWDQSGYKIVACSTYLISTCPVLHNIMNKVIGVISILSLDLHQKTSELLDLLKYVSFMPFADISRVSKLITDKFDLMLKTPLDVWVLLTIQSFMIRLSEPGNVSGLKPKLKVFNGIVLHDSLGMEIKIPSLLNIEGKHSKIQHFIEEISMINIIRGKQFYGSQFMDKSITLTAKWNDEFVEEQEKYQGWTEGHSNTVFPFDAKFCFSKDAIIYAMEYFNTNYPINKNVILNKLSKIEYNVFPHYLCSLRGCTKEKEFRKNNSDLHTTSLDACLDYYMATGYDNKIANTVVMSKTFHNEEYVAQYSMSEKEQRGGGRPIATPTLLTKMGNVMIEKPEQAIGTYTRNNILVAGKHKLKTQSETYKELIEEGYARGLKQVYQCTEDQSKFSENDNTRKYYTYIRNNPLLPEAVRELQIKSMYKMIGREHLVKRLPTQVKNDHDLIKYVNSDSNGVIAIIGWPQGMLNNISTSIHSIADYWITYVFNKAYGTNIITKGLVHSDDSWYAIACNDKETFIRFAVFRALAKKLFCLKLNDKKLWGSKMLGELVSNFNINGEVLVPVAKVIANGFGNLLYQNWVIDVHTQISTIQQVYRNGCNIGCLVMLATVLRQQIISAYNLHLKPNPMLYTLPIEMGGYPKCSAFELGVAGVNSHYKQIFDYVNKNPRSKLAIIVLRTMNLSMQYNIAREESDVLYHIDIKSKTNLSHLYESTTVLEQGAYESIVVPKRGEVFSCIKHIMPKSKKISLTVKKIQNLPFETDNLELLVTRPKDLGVALGHLKSQMSTILFSLASEKYTGSKKRLAINQSIQATGKTVQIAGLRPMTLKEMTETILMMDGVPLASIDNLKISFEDDTNIVGICSDIVYHSDISLKNFDKRKCINRMPDFEDKYRTICPLRNVLLHIIDRVRKTNFRDEFTGSSDPIELIDQDADLVLKRFSTYFAYYSVEYACNLIMQQYFSRIQPRLWTQCKIRNDDLTNFLSDLYGCSLNNTANFNINIDVTITPIGHDDNNLISSMYTVEVLNTLYQGQFKMDFIGNKTVNKTLELIDYANLSQSNYLKFGILKYIYDYNMRYLVDYDNKKVYSQYYLKAQKVKDGTYKGDFKVYIKYGNLVMIVEGEPEDLLITVNNNNIQDITMAMFIYVNRDHVDYAYNYYGSWNLNKFWASKIYQTELKLMCYGQNMTVIKKGAPGEGVSIIINKNIKYPIREPVDIPDRFEFDNGLRVVYKIYKNTRIRVDNVKQNMNCPYKDKITLQTEYIDGFSNNELLKTGVILNITMRRSFSVAQTSISRLLDNRVPATNMKPVLASYLRFAKVINKEILDDIPETLSGVETVIEAIGGMDPESYMEEHEKTSPEDLTGDEVGIIFSESERAGALTIHGSFTRLFCKYALSPFLSQEIEDFMLILFKNKKFIEMIKDVGNQINNEELDIDMFIEMGEDMEFNKRLYLFIVSNELDNDKYINRTFIRKSLSDTNRIISSPAIINWVDLYVKILNQALEDEGEDDFQDIINLLD